MTHRILLSIALVSTLALTACGPSRSAEDAKLSKACQAALAAMYDPEDTIEVKETKYVDEKSAEDTKLRTVHFHAYYTHQHGAIEEKDYSCAFEESPGLFGFSPRFYRMDRGDIKYGNFDGTINGGLDDMLKITTAVNKVLG
jgi:hypothetical protein